MSAPFLTQSSAIYGKSDFFYRCGGSNTDDVTVFYGLFHRITYDDLLNLRTSFFTNSSNACRERCPLPFTFTVVIFGQTLKKASRQVLPITPGPIMVTVSESFPARYFAPDLRNAPVRITADKICRHSPVAPGILSSTSSQNGTRQTGSFILTVTSIPLHSGHLVFSSKICRHRHKPAVVCIFRHSLKLRIILEK